MPLSTGQILNQRYRIVKLLGQGGFGAVYRAWDVNFQMPCALKENFETSPEAQRQFQREAKILHTLRHPGLPLVKDYFIIPGQGQYLVMDYVEGEDLQTLLLQTKKPISEDLVIGWLRQVCEALVYLHSQMPPVIHRDIKPANIRITGETTTSAGKAVLVDFGIAKVFQPGAPTTTGARAVSPGYAPFEQYGRAPTDARTDLYALGATAYALLTCQAPTESIARMAGSELPAPSSLNGAISVEMERVMLKALANMPADRYQSAAELLDDLKRLETRLLKARDVNAAPAIVETAVEASPVQITASKGKVMGETAQPQAAVPLPVFPTLGRKSGKKHALSQTKGKARKSRAWIWIVGLVVIAAAVFAVYAWQTGMLSGYLESGEERFAGNWSGILHTKYNEELKFFLEIHLSLDARFIYGMLEIVYPDGRVERNPIEGSLDGNDFRLRDFRSVGSVHLWGKIAGTRLVGLAAWNCYACDAWGEFELRR